MVFPGTKSSPPPIVLFGGQGSPNIYSAASTKAAQQDAEKSFYGALLLSKWHAAVLEALKSLDLASLQSLGINSADFRRQKDLLQPPERLHENPLIASITICLFQLLRYLSEFEHGLSSKQNDQDRPLLEATGICSGLIPAAVAATSRELCDVVSHGLQALRLAFWIGVRVGLQSWEHECGSGKSSSWCLVVTGVTFARSTTFSRLTLKAERTSLKISALLTPSVTSVTGFPSELAAFAEYLEPIAAARFSYVHGWFHGGYLLHSIKDQVCEDIRRENIEFPNLNDLIVPIRSSFDGSLLTLDGPQKELALWVVEHLLIHPVDWIATAESIYTATATLHYGENTEHQDIFCFGPSSESLFAEIRTRDRQNIFRLHDMSPFKPKVEHQAEPSIIRDDDIAIVGMGVHLPKGRGEEELWRTLSEGLSAVSQIPDSRFDASIYNAASKQGGSRNMETRHGVFLDDIWHFDNEFFAVSPREAKSMDPQQRLLLHTSQNALDDAGYVPDGSPAFSKATFGCYVGLATGDYTENLRDNIDAFYSTGTLRAFHSGKISFANNFSGPTMTTDTACSSSLVSIYHACRALRNGDCTAALAGGVNTISGPDMYLGLSRGHFLSSTGGCKPFDASADGYCRAEGCAMFVLKRLSSAVAENDRIHAVIKSVEVNQSGTSASITHPDSGTQLELFKRVLRNAAVDAATVNVVEAHGTGTAAGDPCEIASLRSALGGSHSVRNPLVVSSIKGNIGHSEAASGAAGLAKLILAMRHKTIPLQAGFDVPNPRLQRLEEGNIDIPTVNKPWESATGPRRALLNNFGAAGSNAALLLEDFPSVSPKTEEPDLNDRTSFVFNLSAKSPDALKRMVAEYTEFLKKPQSVSLADVCYTATARREIYSHRLSLSCSSIPDLSLQLQGFQADLVRAKSVTRPIVFVFSGQGSLYPGMGQALYNQSRHFRENLLQCDAIVGKLGFPSFIPFITSASNLAKFDHEVLLSQCAYVALEYSLASLLISWNIVPSFAIGHSLGEYAALVISGALTLEACLRVVANRAQWMKERCPLKSTGMSACKISQSDASAMIKNDNSIAHLVVACSNSENDCVIAGPLEELDRFDAICKQRQIKTKRLDVPYAFHSPAMQPVCDDLREIGSSIQWREPRIPVGSNVDGRLLRLEDLNADYFANHALRPVRFAGAFRAIREKVCTDNSIFLDIGPHPITLPMVRANLDGDECTLLPTLHKGKDDWSSLNEACTKLALLKDDIRWRNIFEGSGAKMIKLPSYPLQGERFCVPYKEPTQAFSFDKAGGPFCEASFALLHRYQFTNSPLTENSYEIGITMASLNPLIAGHVVGGVAICPASVYHELILEAIMEIITLHENEKITISNMQFPQPLVEKSCTSSDPVYIHLSRRDKAMLQIEVWLQDFDTIKKRTVCTADVVVEASKDTRLLGARERALTLRQISYLKRSEERSTFHPHVLYNSVFSRVVSYSDMYQTLKQFNISSSCLEGEGTFRIPEGSRNGSYVANPVFLDTLLHAAGFIANLYVPNDEICICARIGSIEVLQHELDLSQEFRIYCSLVDDIKGMFLADTYALTNNGEVAAVVRGMEFKRLRMKSFQNFLHIERNNAKDVQDIRTPELERDTGSGDGSETPSSIESNIRSNPKHNQDSISNTVLRAVSDATGFAKDRLQSSVPLENLGIDSMMQIEITTKLQQAFPGNSIDHRSLSECDTIQALEKVLHTAIAPLRIETAAKPSKSVDGNLTEIKIHDEEGLDQKREHTPVVSPTQTTDNPVLIQHSRSEKTPVFLIHDGSGQVGMYARMDRVKDRKIYAFRDVHQDGELQQHSELNAMAAEYVCNILDMEVSPVILGGWSFGGVVAFEMANQLKEAGVVVKGLILIDSPFPVNHQPLPKQISSAVVEGIYSRLDHKTKSKTSKAFERHASMLATYTPPTHCSPVTVALKSNESIPTEEKYGVDYPWLSKQDVRAEALDLWSTLVGGRLETLDVSGNHFQALDPDNIIHTSAQLALACNMIDGSLRK